MKLLLLSIPFFYLVSCKQSKIAPPVWMNPSATLMAPDFQLKFSNIPTNTEITLNSFIQPIPLKIKQEKDQCVAALQHSYGVVEGPAEICIHTGTQYYYFPVILKNKNPDTFYTKDYRSSKTINPDSSLVQQKILHVIDKYRNLHWLPNTHTYFQEADLTLAPKTGVFKAIEKEAISAYYVQPGSVTAFSIQSETDPKKKFYTIQSSVLKDKYGNLVADGTLIKFFYVSGNINFNMETTAINGVATIQIPIHDQQPIGVYAKVNQTISNTINLFP